MCCRHYSCHSFSEKVLALSFGRRRAGVRREDRLSNSGQRRRFVAKRLFEINQAAEAITKFTAGAMQTAPNRSHRDIENRADLLVTMTVEIFQYDHGSMFRAKFIEGVFHDFLAFRPLERESRVGFG